MKKDVKKSSYYVWFLGAQECKNVRDVDSIIPVISALAEREKKVTPYKFTLQVSHRGLKIVHNVSALSSLPGGGKSSKSDLVKHLIPDHAVTCVHQDEDLVAVILLLYNPVTKWPVHVHVYRCDSVETATLLSGQLQMLIDRPENKKKLNEMESRLQQTKCSAPDPAPALSGCSTGRSASDERIVKRESPPSSSSESGMPAAGSAGGLHMTTLYDSLAAELKKKLGTGGKTGGAPILLPPRDYDTVHRHRGNLNGIDFRRCMSTNIVGVNGTKQDFGRRSGTKMGSSGGSSGIGSDHAPSPEQYEPENRYADNNSSSDEDWNASPLEDPLFAKPTNDHPLPRIRRQDSGVDSGSSPAATLPEKDYYGRPEQQQQQQQANFKRQNRDIAQNLREKYSDRNVALVQPRPRNSNCDAVKNSGTTPVAEFRRKPVEVRQRTPSPSSSVIRESPRERFKDAKEKFLMLEKERIDEQRSALKKCLERQRKENVMPAIRAAVRSACDWSRSHDSEDEMDRGRRYNDDDFDDKGLKNVRRSNRSRESLDNDYNGGYSTKHIPNNNRRSRNLQQDHDEPRPAPRSYSAEDYLDRDFRPSPPEDRYKSPQRRTAAVQQQAEAPRVAPRRSNHFNDAPLPPAPSRLNDHKRRSTAYAYEDCGDDYCPPPNFGGGRQETSSVDDDGRPPVSPMQPGGREYKRRSAAYAYEDQLHLQPQHHHQHHHHQQDLGGGSYNRREMMADRRVQADDSAAVVSPVSPRYRHSYAEAYHRHHHQPPHHQHSPSPQDHPVYRHNGSLQPSGRIGIAAIHPY